MPLKQTLSRHWFRFQRELFPWLEEALGPLGERYQRLVRVVELVWVEESRSGSRSGKHPVNEKDRFLLAFNSSAFIGFHRISDSRVCNGSIVAPLGREEIRFSSWSFVDISFNSPSCPFVDYQQSPNPSSMAMILSMSSRPHRSW